MKTVIIGPSGSGKSFITEGMKGNVLNVDDFVSELYKTDDLIEHFMFTLPLNKAVNDDATINKGRLLSILLENPEARKRLEDFLFIKILDKVNIMENSCSDIFVDGLMPRFVAHFDRVIYIEMRDEDRLKNLVKRGISEERAKKLIDLQRGMFHTLLVEDLR